MQMRLRILMLGALLAFGAGLMSAAQPSAAGDKCSRLPFGSIDWWNCKNEGGR